MERQDTLGAGKPAGGMQAGALPHRAAFAETVRAGIRGGLAGGVLIWVYEAIVLVGGQHLMPLAGILSNATGLTFGKAVQDSLGIGSYFIGTVIHFVFALLWGIVFAVIWPWFRRRGFEATFVALFFAIVVWSVMHVLIVIASNDHPNYFDLSEIIGGFVSHLVFAAPLALVVKRSLAPQPYGRA